MGIMVGNAPEIRVVTKKSQNGKPVGNIRISQPSGKKVKHLRYNFKQISLQILQAKTSGTAGKVVVSARTQVASLPRKVRNGEYDEQELEKALIHAKKMVRIARKKMRHLKEEEHAERQGSCFVETGEPEEALGTQKVQEDMELEDSEEKLQKLREEIRALQEDSMEAVMETASGLGELEDELMLSMRSDMTPEEIERMKKKHRSDELREITAADMEYLKALMSKLQKEKESAGSTSSCDSAGVSMQLSGAVMSDLSIQTAEAPVMEGGCVDVSV